MKLINIGRHEKSIKEYLRGRQIDINKLIKITICIENIFTYSRFLEELFIKRKNELETSMISDLMITDLVI
jgi:hypothetical protein